MITNPKDYFCILGGGGIRGISYIGAFRAFKELEINPQGWAGSSVGSVVAALKAVNASDEFIEELLMNFSPDIFKDINLDFRNGLGFSKGEKFLKWIREAIEKNFYGEKYIKGEMDPVRFKDVAVHLVILSTNLTDLKFKEFSRFTTPNIEIAQAIRASVSIPGLFQPVEIGNEIFVDGDLTKNWPLWRMSKNVCPPCCRVLEFRLEDNQDNIKIDNSLVFLNAVYNTVSGLATDFLVDLYSNKDKFDYIKINSNGISFADFTIDVKRKKELIENGYLVTMSYFKNDLPKKRANLKKIYSDVLNFLLDIQKEACLKNLEKGNCVLGEMFMYLCDFKDYMDSEIYKKLIFLKQLFKENLHYIKIFGVGMWFLNNRELINANLKEIINIFEEKIEELSIEIV